MAGINKKAVGVAATGVLIAGLALVGAGSASADTTSCSDTRAANTNGNPANDLPQQANKSAGALIDTGTCAINNLNKGLNGADDARPAPDGTTAG
ncbi:hypothetical protein [Streptomyces sp. NPDC051162]|uniref:hypothetical protein n=1 Tax=Streptomyces sp. NPDC051162 TaxID=3154747 RepID=UPI003443ED2C